MVIGAIIMGILICVSVILTAFIDRNSSYYFDTGFIIGGSIATLMTIEVYLLANIIGEQKLFDAIKELAYEWDAQTKTLKKLVKPKFDPKTLVAFDKVLVRLTKDCIWNATFFSHYDKEVHWGCYPFVTTSCKSYDKCIPYNDETKHLLGTSDEAPEYYRYWED